MILLKFAKGHPLEIEYVDDPHIPARLNNEAWGS
jgi:hypothetical protein